MCASAIGSRRVLEIFEILVLGACGRGSRLADAARRTEAAADLSAAATEIADLQAETAADATADDVAIGAHGAAIPAAPEAVDPTGPATPAAFAVVLGIVGPKLRRHAQPR
jgi:hypothetical protein